MRDVYLPSGASWYDFYTGRRMPGGQTIKASAPFERIPLFVRAGSIVPTGPAVQFTGQDQSPPLTILVYTGANGSGSIYEDDGLSRQYLRGAYARIPLRYDDRAHTLRIGSRQGSYEGMAQTRTIRVQWITPGRPLDLDRADQSFTYSGKPLSLHQP
jgi:alpha-D-xyloside xylohydrolase